MTRDCLLQHVQTTSYRPPVTHICWLVLSHSLMQRERNEWGCVFGDNRRPPFTCPAGRWLNTTVWTQTILTERRWNGDGTETWRIVWISSYTQYCLCCQVIDLCYKKRLYTYITQKCKRCDYQVNQLPCFVEKYLWLFLTRGFVFSCIYLQLQNNCLIKESTPNYSDWNYLYKGC